MATQTEVVTVSGSEDQVAPDTVQEQNGGAGKKQNWLRRRFKKDKDEKKSRKPPGEKIPDPHTLNHHKFLTLET